MRFGTLLLCVAAAVWAQLPRMLPLPAGYYDQVPVAAGSTGDLWIAGLQDVMRLDRDGQTRFTARLDGPGNIIGMAVGPDGVAGVLSTDFVSGWLTLLTDRGEVVRRVELAGTPASIAYAGQGSWVVAGRARDGFVGTPGAYRTGMGPANCSYVKGRDVACDDAYLMKIGADGRVIWATLFGGASDDFAQFVAVDATGGVWIAGKTQSTDVPVTATAVQKSYGGGETLGPIWYGDVFLARFDPTGARLEYSTYLGGKRMDQVGALTIVPEGVLVTGRTESADFPVAGAAYQRALLNPQTGTMPGTGGEAYVSLLSRDGTLVYSSYFGGAGSAIGAALGDGREVLISVAGKSNGVCVVNLQLAGAETKLTPGCGLSGSMFGLQPVRWNGAWFGVRKTAPGLPAPGITSQTYVTVAPFGDSTPPPAVAPVWAMSYAGYRTAVAADAMATLYLPVETNLTNAGVLIGGRPVPVLFAGKNQINFYVPADVPVGVQEVTVVFPYFSGIPVPVDVAPRWPGLGGTVEQVAARGDVVRLIATGLGPPPYSGMQVFVETEERFGAQGMEILGVERVAEDMFHVSVRIPQNAKRPGAAVRVVFQGDGQPILSNLVSIGVR